MVKLLRLTAGPRAFITGLLDDAARAIPSLSSPNRLLSVGDAWRCVGSMFKAVNCDICEAGHHSTLIAT